MSFGTSKMKGFTHIYLYVAASVNGSHMVVYDASLSTDYHASIGYTNNQCSEYHSLHQM